MIIYDSQGRPINIREDSPPLPTWREVADQNNLRVVVRNEKVFGRSYTFYDIYKGETLIAIE